MDRTIENRFNTNTCAYFDIHWDDIFNPNITFDMFYKTYRTNWCQMTDAKDYPLTKKEFKKQLEMYLDEHRIK